VFSVEKFGQRKIDQHFPLKEIENTFQSKKNLVWFPGKYFSFILG